jgi:hypothetical protein
MSPKVFLTSGSTSPYLSGDTDTSSRANLPDSTYGNALDIDLTETILPGIGLENARVVAEALPLTSSTRRQLVKLLLAFQLTVTQVLRASMQELYLPQLQAHIAEDGSVLLEWISSKFRLGFNIEHNPPESSWFVVTSDELGGVQAAGQLNDIEMPQILRWFSTFLMENF